MRKYQNRQNCAKPDFNWCLFFALCPSIWAQFYIAPKYWMSGHFELWDQDWIRQKPQQSPMRMVRRERETVVRRKSLFMNRRSQKWPVWGWGGRENKQRMGCFFVFCFFLSYHYERSKTFISCAFELTDLVLSSCQAFRRLLHGKKGPVMNLSSVTDWERPFMSLTRYWSSD